MNHPTTADVTARLEQHQQAAIAHVESVFDKSRLRRDRIAVNVSDAMEVAIDLASNFQGDDLRRYWFQLFETARREYERLTRKPVSPVADYLLGGEVYEKHANEAGFDADWRDEQPEDSEARDE